MIALAVGTMIDAGAVDPRRHVFVATGGNIATLVLARAPLTPAQLKALRDATARLGFDVLVDPDREPRSEVLRGADDGNRSRSARPGRPVGLARPHRPHGRAPFLLQSAAPSKHSGGAAAPARGTKSGLACFAATSSPQSRSYSL